MSDHEAADARLEQALSIEFSNFDSDLFSEKVASRVSRMIYLRYLVLSIGWLTGLAVFFLMLPVLSTTLMPMNSFLAESQYNEFLLRLSHWFIPATIILLTTITPALLSGFRPRVS